MYNSSNSDLTEILIQAGLFIFLISSAFYASYRRKHRPLDSESASVLLSYYTEGAKILISHKGRFGDLRYSTVIVGLMPDINNKHDTGLLYRVELPFRSSAHLLGVPTQANAIQIDPSRGKTIMERVELEGDYSKYFTLFAQKNSNSATQYILDPKAMVFTIDFCQSQSWEIVGSELYFIQTGASAPGDLTAISEDVEQFVKEITPAVARPLTENELKLLTPYNEERRTDLKCPLCSTKLVNNSDYLFCPNNHGVLLNGAALSKVNKKQLKLPANGHSPTIRNEPLECPSCGQEMKQISYVGGNTTIDSCGNCPYRWLDAGELTST